MIKVGSLFAGIGGFELGAQRAFNKAGIAHQVLFQVEQNKFCQKVLNKHWPNAQIFDDVRLVGSHNLPYVDILMGGFPCQDISQCGKQKGIINGKKSSLWFQMLRVIGEIRPKITVLENVPSIIRLGGTTVITGLTQLGYDCQWTIISARQFGAPHIRKRWFCIATDTNSDSKSISTEYAKTSFMQKSTKYDSSECKKYWDTAPIKPVFCTVDDGIPDRLARLKALGNAIVPQCSEYIFQQIIKNILQ